MSKPLVLALEQASQALFITSPNPRVGCVITNDSGQVLGLGHTQQAGGPHAEIMALRDAQSRGHNVRSATAYVTLEPCSHQGRTGPCCDALIDAGIAKVIACSADPNPRVAGQGFARMQAAGVSVKVLSPSDPLAVRARTLNIGFFSRMVRKRPWVRMKIAASLDGQTALANGLSQWITSSEARAEGHFWRARACAVMTGIGTVLADNPRLDVRLIDSPRQPALVVVDSRLDTPIDAALFAADPPCYFYAAAPETSKILALQARGVSVTSLPDPETNFPQRVDLAAMLTDLAQREINELHVESGPTLNGGLVRAGLVDEFLIFLAPKLLGAGRGMINLNPLMDLTQALQLNYVEFTQVGPDLRILAHIPGSLSF